MSPPGRLEDHLAAGAAVYNWGRNMRGRAYNPCAFSSCLLFCCNSVPRVAAAATAFEAAVAGMAAVASGEAATAGLDAVAAVEAPDSVLTLTVAAA
jgi:hypothetical protein